MPVPTLSNGIYSFTLTTIDNQADINCDNDGMIQSFHEFIIGLTADFKGGSLKIYRYLSANTGWVPYVLPTTGNPIVIGAIGAGYGLGFYPRLGKIRFSLEGAGANASVPIDFVR